MKLFRHYGRSYIYDKLHRGFVTTMVVLGALSFLQLGIIVAPSFKRHIQNSWSSSKEDNAAGTENKNAK